VAGEDALRRSRARRRDTPATILYGGMEQFQELLASKESLATLVPRFSTMCVQVGMHSTTLPAGRLFISTCGRCNTIYAQRPHKTSRKKIMRKDDPFVSDVHDLFTLLQIVAVLFTVDLRLDKKDLDIRGLGPAIPTLMRIVDNCNVCFPRVAQSAMGVLSVAIARRPCSSVHILDGSVLSNALYTYCHTCVFDLISNSCCETEKACGFLSLVDAIPCFYYMTHVSGALELLDQANWPCHLTSLLLNLITQALFVDEDK